VFCYIFYFIKPDKEIFAMKIRLVLMPVLAVILSINAHATTVLYKNFDNLVDGSDDVVGGSIASMVAKKHKNGEIYTVVTLTNAFIINETGKTTTNRPIKIRYKGGEVSLPGKSGATKGVEGLYLSGTPELAVGEQVILFISNNGTADMPIYGWEQGLFHIDGTQGVNDAKRLPVVALDGAHLVLKTPKGLVSKNKAMPNRNAGKGTDAVLISSDGGADIVVNNEQANIAMLDKLSSYSAMHVSNFVSMIQERKAMKTGIATQTVRHPSALFTLPEVSSIQASAHINARNSLQSPLTTQGSVNKNPVKPTSRPKHNDIGE
jgi:hypothetical protein